MSNGLEPMNIRDNFVGKVKSNIYSLGNKYLNKIEIDNLILSACKQLKEKGVMEFAIRTVSGKLVKFTLENISNLINNNP